MTVFERPRSLCVSASLRESPSSCSMGVGGRCLSTQGPWGNGFGVAMSSSPWERLWNGDEDVASPFRVGGSFKIHTSVGSRDLSPLRGLSPFREPTHSSRCGLSSAGAPHLGPRLTSDLPLGTKMGFVVQSPTPLKHAQRRLGPTRCNISGKTSAYSAKSPSTVNTGISSRIATAQIRKSVPPPWIPLLRHALYSRAADT
jgi:hypothetical protein